MINYGYYNQEYESTTLHGRCSLIDMLINGSITFWDMSYEHPKCSYTDNLMLIMMIDNYFEH